MIAERENNSQEHAHLKNMKTVLDRNVLDWTDSLLSGFPCGVLRCTYEKHPKAIYANDWMFRFMGTSEDSEDWREFIQQNIFFMIPFEEREIFKRDLQRAAESQKAIPVEHRIRNCSGGKTSLVGWVRTAKTKAGDREYIFLYMPVSETYFSFWNERETAYETVLKAAYDVAFRIEWRTKVMECIHTRSGDGLLNVPGMRIILSPALKERLVSMVCVEDRAEVAKFFADRYEGKWGEVKLRENHLSFHVFCKNPDRETVVIAVDLDDRTTLFCCKNSCQEAQLKQQMIQDQPVCNMTSNRGNQEEQPVETVVYKVSGAQVYLEHGDDDKIKASGMLFSEFLEQCRISEGEYWTAIRDGKTELAEQDPESGGKRTLYAVRRSGTQEKCEEYLLFIYIMPSKRAPGLRAKPKVTISTFGYFDILVDGKPIIFRNQKSKEMLAILVDRKGSFVSNPYFISCLWGDEPYSEKIRSRCRQTAFRMMKTLEQYGIDYIIEKVDGHRRIVPELVDCDYFNYLNGEKTTGQTFGGAYMSDYTWGEETLSSLIKGEARFSGQTGREINKKENGLQE